VTCDGRNIIGTLQGYDNAINVILEKSVERIYSETQGVIVNELGLHVIRGDNIAMVAEFDEEKDAQNELSVQRAAPLRPVIH